uniref:Uncharacterized protein n=1 Tax=Anopheles farauti TaxID=69004 RepID=A0A182QWM2_9DIPT
MSHNLPPSESHRCEDFLAPVRPPPPGWPDGSTTAAPRSAYPGAPPPAPATVKGLVRPPAMTSPASGIPGAPYRGTAWTQGYAPTQPTYRYTAPQTYAYTPHTTTQLPVFNHRATITGQHFSKRSKSLEWLSDRVFLSAGHSDRNRQWQRATTCRTVATAPQNLLTKERTVYSANSRHDSPSGGRSGMDSS